VDQGDCAEAIALLEFKRLSSIFVQLGVQPNITEGECAKWVSDLVLRPLLEKFRMDEDHPHKGCHNGKP